MVAPCACAASSTSRAHGVGDAEEIGDRRGLPVEVDGHHHLGAGADRRVEPVRVHGEVGQVDVDEPSRRAGFRIAFRVAANVNGLVITSSARRRRRAPGGPRRARWCPSSPRPRGGGAQLGELRLELVHHGTLRVDRTRARRASRFTSSSILTADTGMKASLVIRSIRSRASRSHRGAARAGDLIIHVAHVHDRFVSAARGRVDAAGEAR
jgi:hypothetical protein